MITVFEAVICGVTRRTSAAGMNVTVTVLFDTVCTGICEPCVISASMLFCVDTLGLDTMRTLPEVSSARSATSRFSAPLIEPSARLSPVGAAGFTAPVPPVRTPVLGKARPVLVPTDGSTRPLKFHCRPSCFAKLRLSVMMRASISTCGCGRSSATINSLAACSRSARSRMISVLVRVSICTSPRGESELLVMIGSRSRALA